MFEAMAMGLILFFALLIAGLAVAFVGLRAAGVSSERIGRVAAQFARVLEKIPGLRYLANFFRRHRKAVGIVGTVLAIGLAPFALAGAVLVVVSVAAIYAYGYLAQFADVEEESDGTVPANGISSLVKGYDGEYVPRGSSGAWRPL